MGIDLPTEVDEGLQVKDRRQCVVTLSLARDRTELKMIEDERGNSSKRVMLDFHALGVFVLQRDLDLLDNDDTDRRFMGYTRTGKNPERGAQPIDAHPLSSG